MTHIKSRKHVASRTTPHAASLTAASLLTSLALGACHPAQAQSIGGPSADDLDLRKPKTLDKVEVTGERERSYSGELTSPKATRPLLDTTRTVNVIGADLFTEQGATTLTDVLRNSPGVGTFYVGENGNTSTGDTIYMRGFDSSSSIYVDGVRDLGSISRDVFNIQQVEVTKGPSGADFGRSAPTGSINLASKQASLGQANSATVSLRQRQPAPHDRRLEFRARCVQRVPHQPDGAGQRRPRSGQHSEPALGHRALAGIRAGRRYARLRQPAARGPGQRARWRRAHDRAARFHHAGSGATADRHRAARGQQQLLRHDIRP